MNFKNIPKQQRDMLVLGVMGAITFVMLILNFVLSPAQARAVSARKNITDLQQKVHKAETLLRVDRRNRESMRAHAEAIVTAIEQNPPPKDSRYLWSLQKISDIGHKLGLIITIREHGGTRFIPNRQPYADIRERVPLWVPYAVEVTLEASYTDLQNFLRLFQEENPYASLGRLEILPQLTNPERHKINLILEWPVPRDVEAITPLRKLLVGSST